jgi:hypothetical protein
LGSGLVEQYLRSVAGLEAAEAALRVSASDGSLGAALRLESDAYRERRERLLGILETLPGTGPLQRMEMAEGLAEQEDYEGTLHLLRSLLRDVAALRAGVSRLGNPDLAERLAALARGPLGERAMTLAEEAAEALAALKGKANKLLTMDLLLETMMR